MTPEELRQEWPKIEPHLRVGDIILTHSRRKMDFIPRIIQHLTDSHWSHSALVFAAGDMLPLGGTIIAEAMSPTGVRVHNIKRYSDHPDDFDLGVIRHRKMAEEHRTDFVRDFMASKIDTPYDTARVVDYGFALMARKWFGVEKKITEIDPNRFHCSTFSHRAIHSHDVEAHPNEHAFGPADLVRGGEFEWVFNRQP